MNERRISWHDEAGFVSTEAARLNDLPIAVLLKPVSRPLPVVDEPRPVCPNLRPNLSHHEP